MATYDFSAAYASSFASIGGTQDDQTLLDLLKLYLGIPPEDTTQDEELTRALNFAGDAMETYLDRVIAKRPIDEYFEHYFGTVELHNLPVDLTAPLNIFVNGHQDTGYEFFQSRGKLTHVTRIGQAHDMPMDWRRFDQVTVTYTAGFDPIPSDLAYAICMVAADYFNSEGTGTPPGGGGGDGAVKRQSITGVGSIEYDTSGSTAGGGTISAFGSISAAAAQMVSKYKRLAA